MNIFNDSNYYKSYQAYELTEANSLFCHFFEDTFVESGFLWSNQDLSDFGCVKAEVTCPIAIFPILEIGSLDSAKIIAEISLERNGVKYFLASPLSCSIKGYINNESIYTDRYSILPRGSSVDLQNQINKTNNEDTIKNKIISIIYIVLWQIVWIILKFIKYLKKKYLHLPQLFKQHKFLFLL